jgi:hypothetical protein
LAVRGAFLLGLGRSPNATAESAKDDASLHLHDRVQET